MMRGIKITRGKEGRGPVWGSVIRAADYDTTMLWATPLVCFFVFMHAGELMVTWKDFDATQHMTLEDVATDSWSNPTMIQLTIKDRPIPEGQ